MEINILVDDLRDGEESAILGIVQRAARWGSLVGVQIRLDTRPATSGPRDFIAVFREERDEKLFVLGAVYRDGLYSYHS